MLGETGALVWWRSTPYSISRPDELVVRVKSVVVADIIAPQE